MKEPPGSAVRLVRWVIFWDSIVPRVPVSEDVEFAPDLPLDHLVRLRSREGRDCEVLRPLAEKSKFPDSSKKMNKFGKGAPWDSYEWP
jgi:hypothetical protein